MTRSARVAATTTAFLVGLPLAWISSASAIFLYGIGRGDLFVFPYAQWLDAAVVWRSMLWFPRNFMAIHHWPAFWFIVSGLAVPSVAAFGAAMAWRRPIGRRLVRSVWEAGARPVERGPTDNHGHADWMTEAEAGRIFTGPNDTCGGKVVGVAPSGRLLIDDCSALNGLSLEFTASGGGKTASAASRLALWHSSYVATDPSAELAPMLYEGLEADERRILILNPDREPKDAYGDVAPWARHIGAVNVLDRIDIKSPLASMHVDTIVGRMFEPSDNQQSDSTNAAFFRDAGRDVVTCLTIHTLWAEPIEVVETPPKQSQWLSLEPVQEEDQEPIRRTIEPPPRTLATVSDCISLGEEKVMEILAGIKVSSPSSRARDLAGRIVGNQKAEAMWGGIYAEAARATTWLTVPALAALVSGDTMKVSDIVRENVAVFIQVPLSALGTMLRVAKVLMGAFLDAMIDADGEVEVDRVHFEIEEAALFGKMRELALLRNNGRKYRISMHCLWQSVAGMEEVWGVLGRREWYDNATWRAYSSVRDPIVAKEISEICGKFPALAHNDGSNSGSSTSAGTGFGRMSRSRGRNSSTHEIPRDLLYPWEVTGDIAADEMIILGMPKPLMLKRPFYWTRPELRGKVAASRFYKEAAE